MPSIYQLKPAFQNLLRPLVHWLAAIGITANQVTIIATLLSIGCGGLIARQHSFLILLPPFLLLRMMLNAIDGMLAREYHMKTPLGAILNELGDVISDAALYLPFGLLPGGNGFFVVILVVLAIISEMAGLLGPMVGGQRQYDGPLGKSDRAVTFSIMALLYAAGIIPQPGLDVIWLILIGLSIWTTSNRVGSILTEIKKSAVESTCS